MTNQDQPWRVAGGDRGEEEEEEEGEGLPLMMDGRCDACEPDEAPQPAARVCRACDLAYCAAHATEHATSTRHALTPYDRDEGGGAMPGGGGGEGGGVEEEGGSVARARAEAELEGGAGAVVRMGERLQENIALFGARVQGEIEGMGKEAAAAGGKEEEAVGAEVHGGEGEGAEGAGAEPGGRRKDTVTVERLRCAEHGQEGSLYCKPCEKVICVVCAVQGAHRGHEVITLHQAYVWQKSREGYDLLGCTQRMSEKIKTRWTNPEMSVEELESYVNGQFDELHRLVRLEERRTLHLVDLKEAFLTAAAAEKMAEISVHTERLQEEMDGITRQLGELDQAHPPRAVLEAPPAPAGGPGLGGRPMDIENRPRIPEPRRDVLDPREHGPSMDHGP